MKTMITMTAAASVLLGAASAAHAQGAKPPPPIRELTTTSGLQIAVGKCATLKARPDSEDKSLFAAILGTLVTKGVSALGSAISKAGAEKTWSQSASRNFETGLATFPHCVQVARGTFATDRNTGGDWSVTGWPKETAATLAANGLALVNEPEFLFEGEFVNSLTDTASMTIRPSRVTFQKPIGSKALRGDERTIALFFAISPPGNRPDLAKNPGATLVLGSMEPGTARTFAQPPGGTPRVASAYEAAWFTIGKDDAAKPLTITVLETETQGPDKFLKFIGSVLSDKSVQDKLVEEGKLLVVPGAADDAALKKTIADLTAKAAADEKYAVAVVKVQACAATTNPVADGQAAAKALGEFFAADQAAPKPRNLVTPSMIGTINIAQPATVKGACQALLTALAS